jgi:ABC-type bacteriocin/lantibiotic exporter with double-glycine peptidase domain
MPATLQAGACFGRIEKYCTKSSLTQASEDILQEDNEVRRYEISKFPGTSLVSFKGADISWAPEKEATLQNLNLNIRKGEILMIIGPVSCGKSTLLESMINQNMVIGGSISASFLKTAYCPQTPWIQNDTIRNNITGTSEFDRAWYDFTVSACGLEEDFKTMPEGDMRMAGSDGNSLSGGQKQRVVSVLYCRFYTQISDAVLGTCPCSLLQARSCAFR